MKAGLFCIAAGAAVALAQPLNDRAGKRDVVVETDVVTATAPNVMVWVDQNGNPISTSTEGQAAAATVGHGFHGKRPHHHHRPHPSSQAAPSYGPPSYSAPPAPTSYSSEEPSAPAPTSYSPPETTSSSAPAPSSSSSGPSSNSGYGIVYSPYNDDNSCKSADQVSQDFESISGYSFVRIYGTDCDQVSTVLAAASGKNMKIFAGVYDITAVDDEVQTIIDAAKDNWDAVDTVSIGNEGVQMGTYTVSAVVDAINSARTKLNNAGYSGKVVTVDTSGMLIANPELCQASDFAAANCHAFFNGDIDASGSGDYVLSQAEAVSKACGGKDTMITESGYPWKGETNGMQVPSPANQATAIASLKEKFSSNIILFTSFNDYWKTDNSGTFGAEKYWGILGNAPA